MNITAGKGRSAWHPTRMKFECHAAPPFGEPDELLTFEVITAQLSFGSLGTLRGGTLTVYGLPAGWADHPWPRLVRVRLESEHGEGYIAAGIAQVGARTAGELTTVTLVGVETAYLDSSDAGAVMAGGSLTPGGVLAVGLAMPQTAGAQTRRQAIDAALEPFPSGEAGVTADLVGIIGYPEAAAEAGDYLVDDRARNLRDLGHTITDYVTDATYQAGAEWPLHRYSRQDVPPFAPRRTAVITLDPMTETVDEEVTPETGGTLGPLYPVEGLHSTRTWLVRIPASYATDVGQRPAVWGRLRGLRLKISYQVEIKHPEPVVLTLQVIRRDGSTFNLPPQNLSTSGVVNMDWEVPPELWNELAQQGSQHIDRVLIHSSGAVPANSTPETRNTFGLLSARVVMTREYERADQIVMPHGWNMPYAVGPTHEFDLEGVHVPPFRARGLPGGASQMVAGVVVAWNRNEGQTKCLTGALPYPGQRRRA